LTQKQFFKKGFYISGDVLLTEHHQERSTKETSRNFKRQQADSKPTKQNREIKSLKSFSKISKSLGGEV